MLIVIRMGDRAKKETAPALPRSSHLLRRSRVVVELPKKVSHGGFAKWRSDGHPSSADPCRYTPSTFVAEMRESHWATKQDVQLAVGNGAICTINALPSALHTGEAEMGYARPGHIEGSDNVPFHLLLQSGTGEFKPAAELREHFARTRVFESERVINYCGGGIAATLNALALTLAGHPNVAVYDGSLNEWSADSKLPMKTGGSR
jgi:thiosulfate/3-mercaptopyruvate sulfurtransferase